MDERNIHEHDSLSYRVIQNNKFHQLTQKQYKYVSNEFLTGLTSLTSKSNMICYQTMSYCAHPIVS